MRRVAPRFALGTAMPSAEAKVAARSSKQEPCPLRADFFNTIDPFRSFAVG